MSEKERYTKAASDLHRALAKWPNDTMAIGCWDKPMHLLLYRAERTYEELGYRTALMLTTS